MRTMFKVIKLKTSLTTWSLVIFGALLFFGCSAEKDTLISKTYHNITAHYNAYFYAKQKLTEIEQAVKDDYEPNYNRVLQIFEPVDTSMMNGMEAQVEEAIKKAAIAIQFHKNSDWVDDSYVVIGKTKFYDNKFEEAIQTFKYVNTISKDKDQDANHEGLVALMRTYIDHGEISNAIAVSDFLKKEELSKDNLKQLYLTRAHLYQQREDLNNMVQNLVSAVELMTPRQGSAKIYFIIGQVYQKLGFDAEAHNNYRQCIKSNPTYELSFYASLNMAQVFELARSNDIKKVRRYYLRILKDAKNKEFKDKIYYEMAEFEMKQQELDQAIEYYESSVASSINNNRQKAYSYWKLGLINYDTLKNFTKAKLYYDSTIAVLPQDEPEYEAILERQAILEDFVAQLNTIQLQDSLLRLANMDSLELSALLDSVIVKEERLRAEEEEKQKQLEQRSRVRRTDNQEDIFNTNQSGATWYFYNTSAVSAGQSEFIRRWGNRPLEDHWRRSNKEARITASNQSDDGTDTPTETDETVSVEDLRATQKQAYYQTIPFDQPRQRHADSLIEVAYYNLGNIYNFQLLEKPNAAETFVTLLDRYPETDYEPEVLYQLYLIYMDLDESKAQPYRQRLIADFPNSDFTKTLLNPNFRQENDALTLKMQQEYKVAYDLYQQMQYDSALYHLNASIKGNPENSYTDNLKLLKILVEGQNGSLFTYRYQLQEFLKAYPDSDVNEYAQKLLKAAQELPLRLARLQGAIFMEDLEGEHLFILVYPKSWADRNLGQLFDQFNKENYPDQKLTASSLVLDDDRAMVLVQVFGNRSEALAFYRQQARNKVLGDLDVNQTEQFIITEKNFGIFYETKDLDGYLNFFSSNYLQ